MGRHHSSMGLRYCSVPAHFWCTDHVPLSGNRGSTCTISAHASEHFFEALERCCSGDMLLPRFRLYSRKLFFAIVLSGYVSKPGAGSTADMQIAVLGGSPVSSGVYLLPTAIALSITSILTGIAIRKTGQYRPIIWLGMGLMALGTGLFINLNAHSSWYETRIANQRCDETDEQQGKDYNFSGNSRSWRRAKFSGLFLSRIHQCKC
jgi:hypothetical protein